MAAFVAMTSWKGEFTDAYFAQPEADPAAFGLPTEDDGSREDPLLSDRSWAVSSFRPDADAIAVASTRVVIAVGEESVDVLTGRTAAATAELLGQQVTVPRKPTADWAWNRDSRQPTDDTAATPIRGDEHPRDHPR